ncbi:MAG: M1 family aminopeptidase, partial [Gemmatimonadaceae bacterium]
MHRTALLIVAAVLLPACAPARPGTSAADALPSAPSAAGGSRARPVANPVAPPDVFQRAIARGTRTATGAPGARYWQQWARYAISARLIVEEKRLEGTTSIVYFNHSPDSLPVLWLELAQNYHAAGGERIEQAEVTGGMRLRGVAVNGQRADTASTGVGYAVDGTRMAIRPPAAVQPGDSARLTIEWSFVIPQAGASGRMGWSRGDLFYLAYWYPRMAVYDDVVGWQTDPFLGRSEFYHGFGSYTYTVEVPEGWLVMGTGTLENAAHTLSDSALARMRRAEGSDSVVAVVTPGDLESNVTRRGRGGRLVWTFRADSVRDVAFSVTRRSLWDATRTPVGDRNGDGRADHARVDAIYRESAPRWRNVARYARHAIDFLSRYTGFSYPWPHMTAVEGADIIVGGMEYPMMTLIGGYNQQGDSALYYVTAHELAHMWIPMSLSTDERRYSWIDEGFTTFHENQAR